MCRLLLKLSQAPEHTDGEDWFITQLSLCDIFKLESGSSMRYLAICFLFGKYQTEKFYFLNIISY